MKLSSFSKIWPFVVLTSFAFISPIVLGAQSLKPPLKNSLSIASRQAWFKQAQTLSKQIAPFFPIQENDPHEKKLFSWLTHFAKAQHWQHQIHSMGYYPNYQSFSQYLKISFPAQKTSPSAKAPIVINFIIPVDGQDKSKWIGLTLSYFQKIFHPNSFTKWNLYFTGAKKNLVGLYFVLQNLNSFVNQSIIYWDIDDSLFHSSSVLSLYNLYSKPSLDLQKIYTRSLNQSAVLYNHSSAPYLLINHTDWEALKLINQSGVHFLWISQTKNTQLAKRSPAQSIPLFYFFHYLVENLNLFTEKISQHRAYLPADFVLQQKQYLQMGKYFIAPWMILLMIIVTMAFMCFITVILFYRHFLRLLIQALVLLGLLTLLTLFLMGYNWVLHSINLNDFSSFWLLLLKIVLAFNFTFLITSVYFFLNEKYTNKHSFNHWFFINQSLNNKFQPSCHITLFLLSLMLLYFFMLIHNWLLAFVIMGIMIFILFSFLMPLLIIPIQVILSIYTIYLLYHCYYYPCFITDSLLMSTNNFFLAILLFPTILSWVLVQHVFLKISWRWVYISSVSLILSILGFIIFIICLSHRILNPSPLDMFHLSPSSIIHANLKTTHQNYYFFKLHIPKPKNNLSIQKLDIYILSKKNNNFVSISHFPVLKNNDHQWSIPLGPYPHFPLDLFGLSEYPVSWKIYAFSNGHWSILPILEKNK